LNNCCSNYLLTIKVTVIINQLISCCIAFGHRPQRGQSVLFFRMSVCQSFILRSGFPSFCPPIWLSVYSSIHLSTYRSVRLSCCPSIHPSVYLSICLSVRPSDRLSFHHSIRPSICLPLLEYLSFCPSFRLSICLSIFPFVCPSIHLSINLFVYHLFISLSVCPTVGLSVCPSIRLLYNHISFKVSNTFIIFSYRFPRH
jgi:hypothetical protein